MRTLELRTLVRGTAWLLFAGLLLAGPITGGRWASRPFSASLVIGQETPAAAAPGAEPQGAEPKGPKKRAEPRGRLPAYFGEVVSNDQRDKIYDIQAKVQAQIVKLQSEIDQLEETRDKDVYAVLTPEQLEKVKQLQEAAKAKRAASTASRKKPDTAAAAPSGDSGR